MKRWLLIPVLALAGCTTPQIYGLAPQSIEAGKTTNVYHASELHRDCSVLSIPDIEVTSHPKHGTLRVFRTKLRPSGYKPDNLRYKCRTRLVDGIAVEYTPDPGFTGTDKMALTTTFHHVTGEVPRDFRESNTISVDVQ